MLNETKQWLSSMEEEVNNKTYLIFILLIAAHIIYKANKSIFNKTKTLTFLYLID